MRGVDSVYFQLLQNVLFIICNIWFLSFTLYYTVSSLISPSTRSRTAPLSLMETRWWFFLFALTGLVSKHMEALTKDDRSKHYVSLRRWTSLLWVVDSCISPEEQLTGRAWAPWTASRRCEEVFPTPQLTLSASSTKSSPESSRY